MDAPSLRRYDVQTLVTLYEFYHVYSVNLYDFRPFGECFYCAWYIWWVVYEILECAQIDVIIIFFTPIRTALYLVSIASSDMRRTNKITLAKVGGFCAEC